MRELFETAVFDDLLDSDSAQNVLNCVLGGPWKFVNDVTGVKSDSPSYGFAQLFKHPQHGIVSAAYETVCVPIINKLFERSDIVRREIYHSRAFLQLPLARELVKDRNGVHVDLPMRHLACVYYCDDSEGDTVIYEQTFGSVVPGSIGNELSEHRRVSPKKNRIVVFDGSRYHCSSQPSRSPRCIINFDLV